MSTSTARPWRRVLSAVATAVALGATGATGATGGTTLDGTARPSGPGSAAHVTALLGPAAPAGVDLAAVDLARPPRTRLPRPASAGELDAAVAAAARSMGVEAPAAAALGDVPPVVRGGLVQTLDALSVCATTTRQALAALGGLPGLAAAVQQQTAPAPTVGARLRGCATDVRGALAGLELAVRAAPREASAAPGGTCAPTAAWPVLALDLVGTDTCYHRDYALVVDAGGDDLYDNNAGGNAIDLQPHGRIDDARARGCRTAIPGLLAGDCTPLAAALLDLDGDDRYGLPEAPQPDLDSSRPGDARCTREDVVARFVTQGAGLLGVGVLVDVAGDDLYRGKTGSQGAGHVAGVGLLQDLAGDDTYVAVRNSQGFALVAGVGVLADAGGADRYTFRVPAPLPGHEPAPEATEGNGGVIDDVGACDAVPRFVQGAADVGGLGVLVDGGGSDRYRGAGDENVGAPALPVRTTGSQGFGSNGAVGVLLDLSEGVRDHYSGQSGRTDEHLHVDCSLGGAGLFADLRVGSTGACPTLPAPSALSPSRASTLR